MGDNLVQCYNKGCGKSFDPTNNLEDACCHHPGLPFFHDACKGWSCCNKKYTDFTEFLNSKGCCYSKHSNVKPPEPEKPAPTIDLDNEIIEVKPIVRPELTRPPLETPLVNMVPDIAPSLRTAQGNLISETTNNNAGEKGIPIGTNCKNSGCTSTYQGEDLCEGECVYHSGSPIFHEGMKYWSCCKKKTTDFTSFLNQAGCETGKHLWVKEENEKAVECRWDWHQTALNVVVTIYAKQYCWKSSIVQLNPIRLFANLVFPQQANASFTLDLELQGIIDVNTSQVSMFGTKVEIKLKKAEPGCWSKLDIPKPVIKNKPQQVESLTPKIEAVDLSDL